MRHERKMQTPRILCIRSENTDLSTTKIKFDVAFDINSH